MSGFERHPLLRPLLAACVVEPRFVVPKGKERAEIVVQNGPDGFNFKKGESYVFKYSFKAKEGMRVATYSTRFGQLKGSSGGYQLSGDSVFTLVATNDGINVWFSNLESDKIVGLDGSLSWEDATGEWVNVVIETTFGRSMKVQRYVHHGCCRLRMSYSSAEDRRNQNARQRQKPVHSYLFPPKKPQTLQEHVS